jgi:hypothetical protein
MTLLLAAPAFAQTVFVQTVFVQTMFLGFNDLDGGNCVVNDFVEICARDFGSGGGFFGS